MKGEAFVFDQKQFTTLEEMAETLLHEVNEQIVKIDMGYISNDRKERNLIRWRLQHLEHHFQGKSPNCIKQHIILYGANCTDLNMKLIVDMHICTIF